MKNLKSIFITLTILLSLSNFTFAQTTNIKEICPGDKPTLSWQVVTGTATNCPIQNSNAFSCNFTAEQSSNFTGQRVVDLPSGSCSVQFQCQGSGGSSNVSTAELRVKTLGQCGMCPAGQVPNNTTPGSIYSGNGCITPTATIVGGSCTIAEGQGSCSVPVTFTTTHVNAPGLFNYSASTGGYYNGSVYNNGQSFIVISATTANVSATAGTPTFLRIREMTNMNKTFVVDGNMGTVTGACAAGLALDTDSNTCEKSDASIDLTATNCDIAYGASSCNSTISWGNSKGLKKSTITSSNDGFSPSISTSPSGSRTQVMNGVMVG